MRKEDEPIKKNRLYDIPRRVKAQRILDFFKESDQRIDVTKFVKEYITDEKKD